MQFKIARTEGSSKGLTCKIAATYFLSKDSFVIVSLVITNENEETISYDNELLVKAVGTGSSTITALPTDFSLVNNTDASQIRTGYGDKGYTKLPTFTYTKGSRWEEDDVTPTREWEDFTELTEYYLTTETPEKLSLTTIEKKTGNIYQTHYKTLQQAETNL